MNQQVKRLARLLQIPADYRWEELVAILESLGFRFVKTKGSRCAFVSADGRQILLHMPHPARIVKRYALRQIVGTLKQFGVLGGGDGTDAGL